MHPRVKSDDVRRKSSRRSVNAVNLDVCFSPLKLGMTHVTVRTDF